MVPSVVLIQRQQKDSFILQLDLIYNGNGSSNEFTANNDWSDSEGVKIKFVK